MMTTTWSCDACGEAVSEKDLIQLRVAVAREVVGGWVELCLTCAERPLLVLAADVIVDFPLPEAVIPRAPATTKRRSR